MPLLQRVLLQASLLWLVAVLFQAMGVWLVAVMLHQFMLRSTMLRWPEDIVLHQFMLHSTTLEAVLPRFMLCPRMVPWVEPYLLETTVRLLMVLRLETFVL
ncbi:hypothetical protein B296_00028938 [Ensete ventricosum]|uniref:Uncharacterized protein n=1 Tax=Ensete ventricosum TaxID=4639 RepID=A0A426Y272_ENSVE|nr:hypothetical protein B296_00028938 [Ensete ventricosum]